MRDIYYQGPHPLNIWSETGEKEKEPYLKRSITILGLMKTSAIKEGPNSHQKPISRHWKRSYIKTNTRFTPLVKLNLEIQMIFHTYELPVDTIHQFGLFDSHFNHCIVLYGYIRASVSTADSIK